MIYKIQLDHYTYLITQDDLKSIGINLMYLEKNYIHIYLI